MHPLLKWRVFNPSVLSLFLLLACIFTGQASNVDSLFSELHRVKTDSARYKIMYTIAIKFETSNTDSSFEYYSKAYEIAALNGWNKKMGDVYFSMGMLTHYQLWSDTCFTFLNQSEVYYQKANHTEGVVSCKFTQGTYWMNFENLDSAMYYLHQAETYAIDINDTIFLHKIYNNLGLAYQYTGKLEKAIEYTLLAVKEKEKYAPDNLNSGYINLGVNYHNTGNNAESIKYFKLGYQHSKEQGSLIGMGLSLKNAGDAFASDSLYDSTFIYYKKAKMVFEELNDSNHLSRYYMSTSEVLTILGKEKAAQDSLKLALVYFPSHGSPRLKIHLLNAQCNSMLIGNPTQEELLQIEKMALEAHDVSLSTGLLKEEIRVSKTLFNTYSLLKRNDLAVKYGSTYMQLQDSLFNEEQTEALAEQRTKFETEKKEIEIAFLNKANDLKSSQLAQGSQLQKKQKIIIWLLIGGFIVTLFFVGVIYKLYQKQQKTNIELASKNQLISQQKEEKEVLLKEIHHRVKNNLQIIWSLLDLQYNSITDDQVKLAINDGKNRVNSMAMIHQMLYQNEDAGNIYFKDYIHKLTHQIRSSFSESEKVKINIEIPDKLKFDIDTSIPLGLIITELFTNSLKYGVQDVLDPVIYITLTPIQHEEYQLTISDNGKGMPSEFEIKKSKSLGLKLVTNLSKQLNGKLAFRNNHGAEFIVSFRGKSFTIV
ncbi:MAG: tetratricopeptide repeat-containing sensor histidine kinase [Salibacteraceae bacterium]